MANVLSRLLQSRRVLKDLRRIADALEIQTVLLARLADHYAPKPGVVTPEQVQTATVTYSRDEVQGRILDFVERVHRDTGRLPDDEEIARFLDGQPV